MPSSTSTPARSPKAEKRDDQTGAQYVGSFTCSTGDAQIFVNQGGAQDYANARAAQLSSLLTLLCGQGGNVFRNYNDEIQDNVLWIASCLAHDLKKALELVPGDLNGGAA